MQANNSVMCWYFYIGFIHFMLAGKKLTDFTNIFFPHDFEKNDNIILSYFKDEWINSIETIGKENLIQETKFRLDEISKIENYFHQRKSCSKKLSKHATAFDYIYKVLFVLSATSGGVCIVSSASVVGAPIGIAGASFTLIFSLTTGIVKKNTNHNKKQKKKA